MQVLSQQPVRPSYEVEMEYLLEAVQEIAQFKGTGVECHIDSPGETIDVLLAT